MQLTGKPKNTAEFSLNSPQSDPAQGWRNGRVATLQDPRTSGHISAREYHDSAKGHRAMGTSAYHYLKMFAPEVVKEQYVLSSQILFKQIPMVFFTW